MSEELSKVNLPLELQDIARLNDLYPVMSDRVMAEIERNGAQSRSLQNEEVAERRLQAAYDRRNNTATLVCSVVLALIGLGLIGLLGFSGHESASVGLSGGLGTIIGVKLWRGSGQKV